MGWLDEIKRNLGITQSPVPPYVGWNDYGDPGMGPSQDELDFNKEFMQSMIGNIGSTPKEEAIRAAAAGGGQKEFKTVPLSTTPEVAQYASTPGFSLVQPLKKKHWYNYG